MVKVIGVRFKSSGRIYYFDPLEYNINEGDGVIVETSRGVEYGEVAQGIKEVDPTEIIAPLKPVMRVATDEDKRMRIENSAKEKLAFEPCQQKIIEHGLDMKLVDVEYAFNGSKVVFYFTADERVDFRELVKDLAFMFKTRIELRQIGVRDEAKMLGGLGSCGRPVCCKTFLDDFRPVSIKMAKEQNLSLSPTKISGLCGRLMCCLQYEQSSYETMRKQMPKVGKTVVTVDGMGTVVSNDVITEKTRVRLTLPDGSIEEKEYHYSHLAAEGEELPQVALAQPQQTADEDKPLRTEQKAGRTRQKKQPSADKSDDKKDEAAPQSKPDKLRPQKQPKQDLESFENSRQALEGRKPQKSKPKKPSNATVTDKNRPQKQDDEGEDRPIRQGKGAKRGKSQKPYNRQGSRGNGAHQPQRDGASTPSNPRPKGKQPRPTPHSKPSIEE